MHQVVALAALGQRAQTEPGAEADQARQPTAVEDHRQQRLSQVAVRPVRPAHPVVDSPKEPDKDASSASASSSPSPVSTPSSAASGHERTAISGPTQRPARTASTASATVPAPTIPSSSRSRPASTATNPPVKSAVQTSAARRPSPLPPVYQRTARASSMREEPPPRHCVRYVAERAARRSPSGGVAPSLGRSTSLQSPAPAGCPTAADLGGRGRARCAADGRTVLPGSRRASSTRRR
jgi:hypothetical protein